MNYYERLCQEANRTRQPAPTLLLQVAGELERLQTTEQLYLKQGGKPVGHSGDPGLSGPPGPMGLPGNDKPLTPLQILDAFIGGVKSAHPDLYDQEFSYILGELRRSLVEETEEQP